MDVLPNATRISPVRKLAAVVVAAAFVLGVAACADLPAQVQGCSPVYASGNASKSITASGALGQDPRAHVPTPTVTKRVQVSTTKKGSGLLLGQGDIAEVNVTLYTGADGKAANSTGYGRSKAAQVAVDETSSTLPTVFAKSLMCQTVGSRVTTVMTAAQFYGSAKTATSDGIAPSTVVVGITDIVKGYRGRATGILAPLKSGFPSIVTSGDGTPGLTLDLQEPPKTLQSEVVRAGSGAVVKAGEKVLLQVQAIAWTDPAPTSTFDSTWTSHSPRFYTLTAYTKNSAGYSLDPGSVKSLVGQKVGSQVLVVVPAKYGYASGKSPQGYPTNETLIFVYDILGTY
jgi:hypothetical protein